jgi:dihydrofolate reductase
MGRKMFSGGEGRWEDDPNARGWWGDDPPFHVPVFVVTRHERTPLEMEGGTTFVFVGSVEDGVARARKAAGDRDVLVAGGASVVQQALRAQLVDELQLHFAPLLLGSGTRLFDELAPASFKLERVLEGPLAVHARYRVNP